MPITPNAQAEFWKSENQQEHKARIEMLEFQMAEIEVASCRLQWLALNQNRDKLLNHKNIADTLTNAYSMLDNRILSLTLCPVQP